MSLQLLAKQMEAKGRKGDSMLVHMTPGEVAGLQKLAEAAGGSLSVNPETGLVEANFLKRVLESRLLPTAVGLGVGAATFNPYAGAAAGAAVGGMQAKRNDQDVFTGAALGGISGFGAGSMGAGLTAAGGATAAPLTASQGLSQAGQGISALGTEAGRGAFMSKVGGGAGLISDVSMAAASPMMAPGKMLEPEKIAPDDEMYYTEYNPGQTGQRSSTSTEALQLAGGYAPMELIKAEDYMKRRNRQFSAAEGGLMSLAEGGETAAPTAAEVVAPTASEAALAYLMGERSSSAGLPAVRAPSTPASNIGVGGDGMYAFDPVTGTFLRNPNVAGATSPAVSGPVGTSFYGIGRSGAGSAGGGGDPVGPNPDFDTPEKQAAFYADPKNSVFAAITQAGQKAFGYTPLAVAQDYMAPGFRQEQEMIGMGLNPNQNFGRGFDYGYDYDSFAGDRVSPGLGYMADNSAEMGPGISSGSGYFSDNREEMGGGGYDSGISGGYDSSPGGGYDSGIGGFFATGGLMGLAKGGMKSGGFVVPADVVSMIGEGNTDAGYTRIKSMIPGATAIKGKDGGQADTVKTHIEGKQRARVAHGEMYIPPETVKRMGGAKKLYAMMDRVRQQATGSKKQIKPVSLKRAMA
jgi:hypothetical protein